MAAPSLPGGLVKSTGAPADGLPRLRRYVATACVAWTTVVAGSLGWNWREQSRELEEMARVQAATGFEKDVAYRAWVAARGGVDVWVDRQTQPSPYLAHLPERDLVTRRGTLTLVNPAMMSRQVYDLQRSTTGMRSHITSLNPLRPENAADPWERVALQELARGHREIGVDRRDPHRTSRPAREARHRDRKIRPPRADVENLEGRSVPPGGQGRGGGVGGHPPASEPPVDAPDVGQGTLEVFQASPAGPFTRAPSGAEELPSV